jgi:hypothetical protein
MWIYYFEDYNWQPWENTISFFPFLEDALDTQGNRTLILSWCSVSSGALNITSWSNQYALLNTWISESSITVSVWYYPTVFNSGGWNTLLCRNGWTYHHILINWWWAGSWQTVGTIWFYNSSWYPSNKVLSTWNWYHIVMTKNWTNEKIYVNKELVLDSNSSFDNATYNLSIVWNLSSSSGNNQWAQWKISRLIFETWNWTQQNIDDYYNSIKSLYWIS